MAARRSTNATPRKSAAEKLREAQDKLARWEQWAKDAIESDYVDVDDLKAQADELGVEVVRIWRLTIHVEDFQSKLDLDASNNYWNRTETESGKMQQKIEDAIHAAMKPLSACNSVSVSIAEVEEQT
jgi:hypothetical protein